MTIEVAAAAIVVAGRVLAARRTHPADVAGGWELPGGKLRAGETAEQAVVREVREEIGCRVDVLRPLAGRTQIKPGYELTAHLVRWVSGEPEPGEHDALAWLGPEELGEVAWLAADRPFLAELGEVLLDGSRLPGGNVGGATRIGATVRRPTGPWTPAVHGLLGHLARAGLVEVPEVYGVDERGREVLTYLPGRVLDVDAETASEVLLADAMRWLRRFHDVTCDLDLAGPWRGTAAGGPGEGEIVCHNDFAPSNVSVSTCAEGERVVGVFDWDLAGPATRLEDLAFAAWNWVPLCRPVPPDQAARRLGVMAQAYGGVSPAEILAGVVPRVDKMLDLIRRGQAVGDEGMRNLGLVGEPQRSERTLDALRQRLPAIDSALAR